MRFAMTAIGLLATTALLAADTNLIANGGFEVVEEIAQGDAEGWALTWNSAGGHELTFDDTDVVEGEKSLLVTVDEGGTRYLRVTQRVELPAGDYELACRVKVEEGAVRVWVSRQGWGYELGSVGVPADGQWHEPGARFTLTEPAEVYVMVLVHNPERQPARLRIDDMRLTGEPAVAQVEAVNLALGTPYEVLTRRNYGASTETDLRILTDGEWQGGYWTRANTFVWRLPAGRAAEVMLDLGQTQPISQVAVSAIHGVSAHPPRTVIWVSDDMRTFRRVIEWDPGATLGVAPQGMTTNRYLSPDLQTRGRYVLLAMDQPRMRIDGQWRRGLVCLTELEALAGDAALEDAHLQAETMDLREHLRAIDPYASIPPVDTDFETPHVAWAPEPAAGAPDVLTVVSYVCARDAVELDQRLGMKHRIFDLLRQTPRMDLLTHEALLEELAATPDALLLAATDWAALREPARQRILDLVRAGMGLVWVHPTGEDDELAAMLGALPPRWFPVLDSPLADLPYPLLDELRTGDLGELRCGQIGEGRVATWRYDSPDGDRFTQMNSALWPYCPPGTNEPEDFAYWEMYAAELCKVVLWVAQGEPTAALGPIAVKQADRDGVALSAPATGDALRLRVRAELRDERNRVVAEASAPAAPDGTELVLPGPLQTGPHAAYLWLEDPQGRQVDWRAVMVYIAGPRITSVEADRDRYERGDTVELTVRCEGADGLQLAAELVDFYAGVADRTETDAAAEVALSLSTSRSRSLVCEARVRLTDADGLVDERTVLVPTISDPDLDEYTVGLWSSYGSYIGKRHWGYEMLRSQLPLLVDIAVAGPLPGYPRYDMRPCPENMHRIFFKGADVFANMNLAEPGFRERFLETIRPKMRGAYNWGAYDFSVGDECGYNLKTDEHTLAAMREWLRAKYGDLAALNREWNAAFASWEDVTLEFDPADESVTSHAPGLDHRLFSDWLFIDILASARTEAEALDSRNRVGISGTRDPTHYSGFDYWGLMGALNHVAFYDGLQREAIRSFSEPGDLITSFVGYDDADLNESSARYFPWLELFNGFQGVGIYSASSGDLGGFVRPDLTLTRRAQWLAEEVAQLKGGIGKALLTAERTRPPIAVHYSQRSLHLGKMLDAPTIANLTSVCEIIEDLGYQFDFVADQQIEDGTLAERGYSVLVLPHSLAMSQAEVAAVADWTRAGGTLIVIGAAGLANEHGRMLTDRPTDALLGEQPADSSAPFRPDAGQITTLTIGEDLAVHVPGLLHEYREFQPTGVAGETTDRLSGNEATCASYRAVFDRLFSAIGAQRFATVVDQSGDVMPYVEVSQFERGSVRYLGLIEKYFGGRYSRGSDVAGAVDLDPVTIDLGAAGHVYDMRSHEYLGKTARVQAGFAPTVAKLYAVLPYQVTSVTVDAPDQVRPGGVLEVTCGLQVDAGRAGDHVLHVELVDPSGAIIKPYAVNVLAVAGKATVSFPLPLNAALGPWTVQARDTISGLAATAAFECTAE